MMSPASTAALEPSLIWIVLGLGSLLSRGLLAVDPGGLLEDLPDRGNLVGLQDVGDPTPASASFFK